MNAQNLRAGLIALSLAVSPVGAQDRAPAPRVSLAGATVDVALSVTPASGYCPYMATVTWSATGASVCQKSGYWSGGPVNASGSESIEVNSTSATFTLTCSASTDYRDLTWTNPTNNTDGTTANLSGNKVYHNASSASIETLPPIVITPKTTTYRVAGLPAGVRYFGIKATGQGNVDSAMSNLATATIALPSGAKSVQVGCTTPPPPNPPTGVTISQTVWETRVLGAGDSQRFAPGRDVGRIGLDVLCVGEKPIIIENAADYWVVPRSEVMLYRNPKSTVLLGRCALREQAG